VFRIIIFSARGIIMKQNNIKSIIKLKKNMFEYILERERVR
jgi:hypothetical protein